MVHQASFKKKVLKLPQTLFSSREHISFSVCVLASTTTMNAMLYYPSGISHIVASLVFFCCCCCLESIRYISRLLCWVAEVWDNKLDILSKDKFRCKLHRPLLTQAEADSRPHTQSQTCPLTPSFSTPRGFYKNVYTLNEHTLPEK